VNIQKIFLLFNSFISFLWVIIIYLLNNNKFLVNSDLFQYNTYQNIIILTNIYIYIAIILNGSIICYWLLIGKLSKKIFSSTLEENEINKITPIYKEYIPVFLSIVIISLSLHEKYCLSVLITIFLFLFVFFHMSKISFLNPIFYILGIRVYKLETTKTEYILISNERDYKNMVDSSIEVFKLDEEILVYIKKKD